MMTFCRVKKNLCVVADDENPLQCCFSPGSFLSSAWPGHCPSTLQGQPTGHSSAWPGTQGSTAHSAWSCHRKEQFDGKMQQGQPWRVPLLFLLSSRGTHRLMPIDHVWRVGMKNNLPHGTSKPSFQRLQHEQNWKQDHSLLLPQELSLPKPLPAVVRPCPDCSTTCERGPTSLLHQTRHIQVTMYNTGLLTVVSPTTDISHFRRSHVNQAQKVAKQHLLWKAAQVMLLSCSAWGCENSLLLKLSEHPAGTELPPPSSQGVPVVHSRRWNLSKNAGAVQEDC